MQKFSDLRQRQVWQPQAEGHGFKSDVAANIFFSKFMLAAEEKVYAEQFCCRYEMLNLSYKNILA